jgi:hypothetical protein
MAVIRQRRAKRFLYAAFCLFAGLLPGVAPGGPRSHGSGRPSHSFVHTQNSYVFEGRFAARADLDCLLHIFYDYEHFTALMTHVEDIHLERKGVAWYEVSYTYRTFFYTAVSTFRRTLDLAGCRVLDELVRVRQSGIVTPDIHSIRGHYQMIPGKDGVEVTFYQEGRMTAGLLGGFYFRFAEREAAAFMARVKVYAEAVCRGGGSGP